MLNNKRITTLLFLSAFLLRVLCLAVLPSPPLDDSATDAYLLGAEKLLHGEGFRDPLYPVYAPPLYGMFIAAFQYLDGNGLFLVKVAQAVVDSITALLLFLIIETIFDRRAAILAAFAHAVNPFAIFLTISIASEPLVTCLLAWFLLLSIRAVQSSKQSAFVAVGIVLGLATLTRGTTQFMPIVFLLVIVVFVRDVRKGMWSYAVFIFSFTLVLTPWALRNYMVIDDTIPVATGAGIVVLMGAKQEYLTISGKPAMFAKYPPPPGGKPSAIDSHWKRAGVAEHWKHLREDPGDYLRFSFIKFLRLWYATESGERHWLLICFNLPIYILAAVGAVAAFKERRLLALMPAFVLGYYCLLHWVSLPLFRYMIPVMPYIYGFSARGVYEMISHPRIRAKWRSYMGGNI